MTKGCEVRYTDAHGSAFCLIFCDETGVDCGEENAGCKVCVRDSLVAWRVVTVGDCKDNPQGNYITDCERVYTIAVAVYGGTPDIYYDSCAACEQILAYPCYEDYQDFLHQISHTGFYVGFPWHCQCAD